MARGSPVTRGPSWPVGWPVGRGEARRLAASWLCGVLLALGLGARCGQAVERTATPVFTVAVLGDGFGDALADGLRLDLTDDPGFAVRPAMHTGGLTDLRTDWAAAAKTLVAGSHAVAVAIMLGEDDWRPLRDGAGQAEPGTQRWRALYGDRVAMLAGQFPADVPVIWVGLPIVASQDAATAFSTINEIIRDRASRAGAHYVDSWNAFADENGRYDANGPDKDGRPAALRGGNGRSFTRAGAVKLASFIEADLGRARSNAVAALASTADVVLPREPAFDNDVDAQIRRELGLPALRPSARDAAAGPVTAITAPPLSPEGRLVDITRDPAPLANAGGASLAQRVLEEGRPLPPKPGRIDDFAWPRP